jgi:hypothetical protein
MRDRVAFHPPFRIWLSQGPFRWNAYENRPREKPGSPLAVLIHIYV